MMLDADIVAVSPSSVWRVLGQAGILKKWNGKPSKKGTGFEQPPAAASELAYRRELHQHFGHVHYLCSVLDGYSRSIVHWDLRESMTEAEIEIILEEARRNIRKRSRG
jgi:transposase InsO family protein